MTKGKCKECKARKQASREWDEILGTSVVLAVSIMCMSVCALLGILVGMYI